MTKMVSSFSSFSPFISASVSASLALLTGASLAFASTDHGPKVEHKQLHPATRYSGNTPVDLSNGLVFNNGTYGMPNEEYESWAQTPVIVPGVSEKTYPYAEKADFIRGLKESAQFVEHALLNWEQTSEQTKPEAKEYSAQAIKTMRPALDKFNDVLSKANGAGNGDWDRAQADARQALIDLRTTYSQMHKNVGR